MHLLATETATLDEIETAVDLAQTPADIVVLSFSDSDLSALAASWTKDRDALPSLRLASLKELRHPMSVDLYVDAVISHARLVIVRSLGGLDYWRYGFERIAATCARDNILLVALPGDDRPDARLSALSTATQDAVALFDRYFREGGPENIANALRLAASLLGRDAHAGEPKQLGAAIGLCADGSTTEIDALGLEDDARPAALILFYRSSLLAADTRPILALIRALDREGLAPLAVAVTSLKDPEAGRHVASLIARAKPSIVLNATAFSALRTDDTTVLDAADCPVLQVALAGAAHEAWAESARGLSPSDLAMNVVLPELDGRLFTRAISFKAKTAPDPDLQYSTVIHEPAADRIAFVAKLASSWARLSHKPRAQRRVALVISDYPARGGRTGHACGLDTPESVREILALLKEAGYETDAATWPASEIIARLTDPASGDVLRVPVSDYRAWLAALPDQVGKDIGDAWGAPEADTAVENGQFKFPCLRAGNIIVLLQPDRGSLGDRKQGYQDRKSVV